MLKKIAVSTFGLCSVCSIQAVLANDLPSYYFGADLAPYYHPLPPQTANSSKSDDVGLGFGGYVGYQFSTFGALELGATYFDNDKHNAQGTQGADHYYLYSADILLKGIYPVNPRVSLNGFAGALILHENVYNQVTINTQPIIDRNETDPLPEIGVGVSYFFPKYISLDFATLYAFQVQNIKGMLTIPFSITAHF